ncbi:MAG: aspartate dehydrogenase [Methyloligellaceae bacterium]
MNSRHKTPLRLAIAGLGAIGLTVARRVDEGGIEGMVLTAVSVRDREKAQERFTEFNNPPELVELARLADLADVVVECVPAAHFLEVARPALEAGRIFLPLSVGVLLKNMELVDLARKTGGRIIVPTGALIGLDAVRAARSGGLRTARLVTRKPPSGLEGAPYVTEHEISLDGLSEAKKVFSGTAREAAIGFPANLNVGAALALAGLGADDTQVEIWADPGVDRNIQTVTCHSDSADFTMSIENVPSGENPRTGRVTAHSVIAALERLTSPLVVGS